MIPTPLPRVARLLGILVLVASACGGTADLPSAGPTSTEPTPTSTTAVPTSTTAVPTTTAAPVDLRSIDFANRAYTLECGDVTEVLLTNGEWIHPEGAAFGFVSLGPVAYADLTGDGFEDALVELDCSVGANNFLPQVQVFAGGSPEPVEIGSVPGVYVGLSPTTDGAFEVTYPVYGPDDAHCCPSAERIETWQAAGGALDLIGSEDTAIVPDGCTLPVVGGQLLGLGVGSDATAVIDAVTGTCGPPTFDSDWNAGCPFDNGEQTADERVLGWGDEFHVILARTPDPAQLDASFNGGPPPTVFTAERLSSWSYRWVGNATPTVTLELPPGVAFGNTLDSVAAALGTPPFYNLDLIEIFGIADLEVGGVEYTGQTVDLANPGATPFTELVVGGLAVCD